VTARKVSKHLISTYVTVKGSGRFDGRCIDSRNGAEKRCVRDAAAEAARCAREKAATAKKPGK
jgi:hypothetical protein